MLVVLALMLVVLALVLVFVLVVPLRFALMATGTAIPILTWMTSAMLHLLMTMATMRGTNQTT